MGLFVFSKLFIGEKLYQALTTQAKLVNMINLLSVLVYSWDLLTIRKSRILPALSFDL